MTNQVKQDLPEEDLDPEYWAGFNYELDASDLLLFFAHLAEQKGVSLELKLSEEAKERLKKEVFPNIGSKGYQIQKSIDAYIQQKLDGRRMLERFFNDYIAASFLNQNPD